MFKHTLLGLVLVLCTTLSAFAQNDFKKKFLSEPYLKAVSQDAAVDSLKKKPNINRLNKPIGKVTKDTLSYRRAALVQNKKTTTADAGLSAMSTVPSTPGGTEFTLPLVINPSPNAASVTKEVQDQVDLYTGKLHISVPVHTIKSQNIAMNIALGFSGGGHQVNDIGSWVGLGWGLHAGGVISRVVHNLPDEFRGKTTPRLYPMEAYGYLHMKGEGVDLANYYNLSNERRRQIIDYSNWHDDAGTCVDYNGTCDKAYDLQPDEFHFNFGEYSGKFVFDQDGDIKLVSKQNLLFEKTISLVDGVNKITGFKVITDDGFIYEFGGFEKDAVEESAIHQVTWTSKYEYPYIGTYTGTELTGDEKAYAYDRAAQINITDYNGTYIADDFGNPNNEYALFFNYVPTSWYLTKVTSPQGGEINLSYADNGLLSYVQSRTFSTSIPDLLDVPALSTNDTTIVFISRSSPKLHYPTDSRLSHPILQTFSVGYNYLTLKSKRLVSIASKGGERVAFEANRDRPELSGDKNLDYIRIYSNNMPVKSFRLSYDSYKNNELEDEIGVYLNDDKQWVMRRLGDDEADRFRTFLTSIQEVGENGDEIPPYRFHYNLDVPLPKRMSFHQDSKGYANWNTKNHPMLNMEYYNGDYNTYKNGNLVSAKVPEIGYRHLPILPIVSWTMWKNDAISYSGGDRSANLKYRKAGSLTKVIYPTGGYKEFVYSLSENGLKVDQIKQVDDPVSGKEILTNYSYSGYGVTDWSSFETRRPEYQGDDLKTFSSDRMNPSSLTKGESMGYQKVTVSHQNNGKVETEYYTAIDFGDIEVNSTLDYPVYTGSGAPNLYFPYSQKTSTDWKRGLLKRETVYDNAGALVQENKYSYDFNSSYVPELYVPSLTTDIYSFTSITGEWEFYSSKITKYISAWAPLVSKESILYTPHGNLTNTETYEYNTHQLLKEQSTIDSKGKILKTQVKYPFDFTYPSGVDPKNLVSKAITTMAGPSIHMLNYPIETVTYTDDKISAAVVQSYKVEPTGHIQPYQTFALETSAPLASSAYTSPVFASTNYGEEYRHFTPDSKLKLKLTRASHDGYGNLLDVTTEQASGYDIQGNVTSFLSGTGTRQSYRWGYNHTLPVAQAINAASANFFTEDFEEHALATTGAGFTGEKGYVGDYTVSWAKPVTGSYVISYRYREGGVWKSSGELPYTGPGMVLSLGDAVDEIRIHPVNAQVSSFTYSSSAGMTSQTAANGSSASYEYDGLQRLKYVRDEKKNIVKSLEYGYTDKVFTNVAMSRAFVKTNCDSSKPVGSAEYYWVPAHKYTSTVSQADADAKATAELETLGPAYANQTGSCGYYLYTRLRVAGSGYRIIDGYPQYYQNIVADLFSDPACKFSTVLESPTTIRYKETYTTTYKDGRSATTWTQEGYTQGQTGASSVPLTELYTSYCREGTTGGGGTLPELAEVSQPTNTKKGKVKKEKPKDGDVIMQGNAPPGEEPCDISDPQSPCYPNDPDPTDPTPYDPRFPGSSDTGIRCITGTIVLVQSPGYYVVPGIKQ